MPQWQEELAKHTAAGALNVITYNGQRQAVSGAAAQNVITAAALAAADVVLVSYDTLRQELHRDVAGGDDSDSDGGEGNFDGEDDREMPGLGGGRALRQPKRFHVIPSPLTRLTFWRLCLDEAQLAESATAAAARLCRRLRGVHRWCVTGTPVSRGPEDLHGLLVFLRTPPLHDSAMWRAVVGSRLADATTPNGSVTRLLADTMRPFFWRTSRAEVAHELGVPPQAALLTRLSLSPLEQHFYEQQHDTCAAAAARVLAGDGSTTVLRAQTARAAMRPLLRLRQACDHPQVGSSGLSVGAASNPGTFLGSSSLPGGGNGGVMRMREVHACLLEKARVATEEAQRALAMDCNASAGLALLRNDVSAAIRWYRTVLTLEAEGQAMQPSVSLDKLQRLHALSGLVHAVQRSAVDVADAAQWRKDAQELQDGYLAARAAAVAAAQSELDSATRNASLLTKPHAGDWAIDALAVALRAGSDITQGLLSRMIDATQQRWQDTAVPFKDLRGAQLTLTNSMRGISVAHTQLCSLGAKFASRCAAASEADVYAAGHCSGCHGAELAQTGVVCMLCAAKESIAAIEGTLFGRQMKSTLPGRHVQEADVGAGRSAPSSCETALRVLHSWTQRGPFKESFDSAFHDRAKAYLDAMEAARRHFTKASNAAREQQFALAARDELQMAVTRLRLRLPHEMAGGLDPVPVAMRNCVLYPHDVDPMAEEVAASYAAHQAELVAAKSKLRWLQSLETRTTMQSQGASAPEVAQPEQAAPLIIDDAEEICPVCHDPLGASSLRSFLPCGHTLCSRCCAFIAKRGHGKGIACPKCRARAAVKDVLTATAEDGPSSASEGLAVAAPSAAPQVSATTITDEAAIAGCSAARAASDAMVAALLHPSTGESVVPCVTGWGTKIDAVLRRIMWLRTARPGEKVIVFSQWLEVLQIVQHALAANHVACARAAGGPAAACAHALVTFRTRDVDVLLLPIARGANGLTLVEATHVILVEPLLDPGAEAQAAKRVDRIGQVQPTTVHRFYCSATIESNVRALCAKRGGRDGGGSSEGTHAPALRACDIISLMNVPSA